MAVNSFEKLLRDCERAYLSKYPLIFIQTEAFELVRRVLDSNRFFIRLKEARREGNKQFVICPAEQPSKLFAAPQWSSGEDKMVSDSLNYGPKLNLLHSRHYNRVPCLSIEYIPSNSGPDRKPGMQFPQELSYILQFIDDYTRETDDNSAIRSSLCLMYGDPSNLPRELYDYCAIIEVSPPEIEEICEIVNRKVAEFNLSPMSEADVYNLAFQMLGFSMIQIEHLLHAILSMPDIDERNAIFNDDFTSAFISERKEQLLHREQLLTLVKVDNQDAEIGGMKLFKQWFENQAPCIRDAAQMKRELGVPAPRGVLMCGVPGCGKSMAAKVVARTLKKPLIKMDVGDLMGSYLGESEKNMSRALKLADAMSPCVLWIDELEKGFGGAGSGGRNGDSGSFQRLFGKLLTWMQESKKPCFIFATANDITSLPKEFFRSGRFDELFAIYMPLRDECAEILKNQMKRLCGKENKALFSDDCWDDAFLKEIFDSFIGHAQGDRSRNCFVTGADIEKLVNIAMRGKWIRKSPPARITTIDWRTSLLNALNNTRVYGEGEENLNSIAMNYIRLLRMGMRPTAENSLFDMADYTIEVGENGSVKAGFPRKSDAVLVRRSAYDRALYEALWHRINEMAPEFEQIARDRLLRGR